MENDQQKLIILAQWMGWVPTKSKHLWWDPINKRSRYFDHLKNVREKMGLCDHDNYWNPFTSLPDAMELLQHHLNTQEPKRRWFEIAWRPSAVLANLTGDPKDNIYAYGDPLKDCELLTARAIAEAVLAVIPNGGTHEKAP